MRRLNSRGEMMAVWFHDGLVSVAIKSPCIEKRSVQVKDDGLWLEG